jgi:hypothetical protein
LAAYLKARELPHRVFARNSYFRDISDSAAEIRAVLLAVSDPAIAGLAEELSRIAALKSPLVHFSASAQTPKALGFHPLASFNGREISREDFEKIPFIADPGEKARFKEIFAEFVNPVVELDRARDARYHALCVLLGNIPLVVQDAAARALQKDFGLPRESCLPLLESLLSNFARAPAKTPAGDDRRREAHLEAETLALVAGPVARRDSATTLKHLAAVEKDLFLSAAYRLFVGHAWPELSTAAPEGENP